MATAIDDDPYSWGVEALADYLCNRLPSNPEQVRSILREEEIDGSTFLRYAKLAGGEALLKLFEITRLKAKLALLEAVDDLQTASNAYQDWLFRKSAPEALISAKPPHHGPAIDVPTPQSIIKGAAPITAETVPAEAAPSPALVSDPNLQRQASGSQRSETYSPAYDGPSPDPPVAPMPTENLKADIQTGGTSSNATLKRPAFSPTEGDEQPPKRRIAPVALQNRPAIVNPAFAQPDVSDMEPLTLRTLKLTQKPAYLGRGFLVSKEVTSNEVPGIFDVTDLGEDSFVVVGSHIPPGRRQVVNKAMRHLLARNGRQEDAMRQGFELPEADEASDYDEVLSVEDLPYELDEQTLREIEEDEAEPEIATDRLSQEQVNSILDEFVASQEAKWKEQKLPKKGRAAWQLWDSTKRNRRAKISYTQHRRQELNKRVKSIRNDFLDEEWPSRQVLLDTARVLEQTIDDRCLAQWQYDILTSREPPPFVPASQQCRRPKAQVQHMVGEGELLLSSDDEFVVDDDLGGTMMDEDPVEPLETMDLTQVETPRKENSRIVDTIDLTGDTPTKPDADVVKADDHKAMGDTMEAQVDVPPLKGSNPEEHFRSSKWHGLCSALWKLTHANRMAVFDLARKRPEDAWRAMTTSCTGKAPVFSDNGSIFVQTGVVEMTRLFYMFSKSTFTREHSFNKKLQDQSKMSKLLKALQKYKTMWWSPFLQFLRKVAPRYPTDAQILSHDQLFAEFGDDSDGEAVPDDGEVGEHTPRRRAAVPSEVVLDQCAMDFRAREDAWAAELQERRQRLRAQVAAQAGPMPQESPRLIINEGKKEDEGFVCVHGGIAPKIKDHQIDGVRFLWAQVIRDETERTGGLLAHTMGLGKTMQVITFLVAIQEAARSGDPSVHRQIPNDLKQNRTLIVCPSALIDNWIDELIIWDTMEYLQPIRRLSSAASSGPELEKWATEGGVLIVSYNIATTLISKGERMGQMLCETPTIVVTDEAHKMKNPSSQTNRACQRFSTLSRIALTGSPLANNVGEYYSMINWVAPGFLGPHEEFQQTYGKIIEQGLYRDSTKAEKNMAIYKLRVLTGTIKSKVHRRTVKALKRELPNKHETVIFLEATDLQKKLYNEWIRVSRSCFTGRTQPGFLFAILEILTLICNHPRCLQQKFQEWKKDKKLLHEDSALAIFQHIATKLLASETDLMSESLSRKTSMVTQLLDEARIMQEKVLLFSTSIQTLNYLEQLLKSQKRQCARLDGQTAVSKRQAQTKRFNDDSTEVFLISTGAGGVGLNMQGACRVIIFDTKFNPTDEQQAIGRAYRIGQKKPVHVYRFVMAGTFEADVHNRSVFKTQLASRVVDEKNTLTWAARNSQFVHELRETPNEDLGPFRGNDRILDKLIDANSGRSIKSLIPSDTFEEEEIDHLTEQERQAADNMAEENRKLQRLRLVDPAEYDRQRIIIEQGRARQLGADQIAALRQLSHPDVNGVAAPVSFTQTASVPTAGLRGVLGVQSSNRSAPQSGPEQQPRKNNALLSSFDGASDGPIGSQHGRFGLPDEGNSYRPRVDPVPPPIRGANTYFGEKSRTTDRSTTGSASAAGSRPQATPSQAPSPSVSSTDLLGSSFQTMPFQLMDNDRTWRDKFRDRLVKRCHELRRARPSLAPLNIEQLASVISHEVKMHLDQRLQEQGQGFLQEGQRWDELQKLLEQDSLVYAVAKGRLSPSFLAISSSKDLQSRADSFKGMSLEELAKPSPRDEDLKYLEKARIDAGSSLGRPANRGQSLGDEEVMRTTASRRLQRRDLEKTVTPDRNESRLPDWGHKALADHSPRP